MKGDAGRSVEESRRSSPGHFGRKRQREGSSSKLTGAELDVVWVDSTRRGRLIFDDEETADVLLTCNFPAEGKLSDGLMTDAFSEVHLHSRVLVQSRYFKALLSKRWQDSKSRNKEESGEEREKRKDLAKITMNIAAMEDFASYLMTLRLLYSGDFSGVISDVKASLAILQIATQLLFDECIAACIAFLEVVPWSKDEEKLILQVVSDLQLEEASNLLARLSPVNDNAVEDMLNGLVYTATHSPQNISVSVKTFVARMLTDHGSRDTVRMVLEKAFASSLKTVKDSVEEYSNPNVRGRYDEIEALQRQNLHTAVVNGRSLLWLVERMIQLRVAKTAVAEWSEQDTFTANLKRAFSDDTWRNIAPGLPALVLRCTCRLASAVAKGSIIASSQVRLKLVNDWLPVLIVSRENAISATQNKQLHHELEDVFLRIISTLPIADAQKLLQQCLSFATRNVEDCPHLVSAFNTWFRRASRQSTLFLEGDESDQVL